MINLLFPITTFYIACLIYMVALLCYLMKLKQLSILSLAVAFSIHLISDISGRYIILPYCNMFSEPFFLPLCLAGICLILIATKRDIDGLSLLPLISFLSLIAIFFSENYYPPFTIMSRSIYAHLFHFFLFTAHGLLIAGAYLAIRFVFWNMKDNVSNQIIIWGFAFLCIAGLFGMLWSYVGRADFISWNHYYFHSAAIWFYYAGFLHLRLTRGWNQKKRAWILLGGSLLIFSFDYLPQIGGIHSPGLLDARLYELY